VELGALWEELRRQVEERPAEVRVVARVRRDWLDLFTRMNAAHLVDGNGSEDGNGANVEVVSPPEVRADLAQVAAEVVAQYGIEHAFGTLSQ
jgi:hypothetical protein